MNILSDYPLYCVSSSLLARQALSCRCFLFQDLGLVLELFFSSCRSAKTLKYACSVLLSDQGYGRLNIDLANLITSEKCTLRLDGPYRRFDIAV